MTATMQYVRVYASADGESHFEDVDVELMRSDYAPPAPAVRLSPRFPAAGVVLVQRSAGQGDWHGPPTRQLTFVLAGKPEIETSDGEVRRIQPGDLLLVEDTTGKGHISRTPAAEDVLLAIVQLAG